jgi:hypothetical protein
MEVYRTVPSPSVSIPWSWDNLTELRKEFTSTAEHFRDAL